MGGATSKTTAESIAKQLISTVSEISSSAFVQSQSANTINLSGNCVIEKDAVIDQFIKLTINANILQNIINSTETSNELLNKVKQISTAEAPNLSFSAGADSETFTSLINDLATTIKNSINASCSQGSTSLNSFNCTDNAVFAGKIKQYVVSDFIFKCTQNLENVTKAKQSLQNFIDQHSSAKVEDVIFKILIAIASIMLIYFLGPSLGKLLGGGGGGEGDQSIANKRRNRVIILIAVILIILVLIYFFVIKK